MARVQVFLCPCGKEFDSGWGKDGRIQILCDLCSAFHYGGKPAEAPAWQDWSRIPYTSESEVR